MSATDQMSSTLHGRLKKKERDVGNLESRYVSVQERALDSPVNLW